MADVRIDIDRGFRPDIVASACYLPFRDESFDEVCCDPPFVVNGRGKVLGRLAYWLHRGEWRSFLEMVNREFCRVLADGGVLYFQVDDGHIWGLAHFKDIDQGRLWNFKITGDSSWNIQRPWGNKERHIFTLRPDV